MAFATARAWPTPSGRWPLIGHTPRLIGRGLMPLLEEGWRTRGDRFAFWVGRPVKVIVHPDDVEAMLLGRRDKYLKLDTYAAFRLLAGDGLVSSEGELWRRQRRIIQPSFQKASVEAMAATMAGVTERAVERWLTTHRAGEVFDIYPELMRLTLEILGRTLFSIDLGPHADASARIFTNTLEIVAARGHQLAPPPLWVPTPTNRRLVEALRELDQIVATLVADRRAGRTTGDDLLSALVHAVDEEGRLLDAKLLRDEIVTMVLAGHETTAVATAWILWLLEREREVGERLRADYDRVLAGRSPTLADLDQLGWAKQVIQESMRLYPPVWSGGRDAVEHDELGGLPIEPGDRLLNIQWFTHRHPEFWTQPERFDPERFDPERIKDQHKFAYTPFSAGPRMCVGNHFAMLEAQQILAVLASRLDIEIAPGTPPEPDYQLTTRPKHGIRVRIRARAG
ncbi:cytochrome P450 [Nannocystaceae bacterium ST9]